MALTAPSAPLFPELTGVPTAVDARTVVEDRLRALEGAASG
jgi:hypothetical protein